MIIYTIGHSYRDAEEMLEIVNHYSIDIVIDVRRFPSSRKYPWFNKGILEKFLTENSIEYYWLGDLLGGYREGGYRSYMETGEYMEGIEKLLSIASKGKTAIMCSEKLWFRCHRRFISDTLVEMGYIVIHIIDKDKTYTHRYRGDKEG